MSYQWEKGICQHFVVILSMDPACKFAWKCFCEDTPERARLILIGRVCPAWPCKGTTYPSLWSPNMSSPASASFTQLPGLTLRHSCSALCHGMAFPSLLPLVNQHVGCNRCPLLWWSNIFPELQIGVQRQGELTGASCSLVYCKAN